MAPGVVAVAEAIPFDRLTEGSLERLYALKGEIVARGVRQVLGVELPVYPKRRFQRGAMPEALFARAFAPGEPAYRAHLARLFAHPQRRWRSGAPEPAPRRPALDPFAAPRALVESERSPGPGASSFRALSHPLSRRRRVSVRLRLLRPLARDDSRADADRSDPAPDRARPRGGLAEDLADLDGVKLYNASNFFDERAVPAADDVAIAAGSSRSGASSSSAIRDGSARAPWTFARRLSGRLEVAMGLETVHPEALARLRKGMTLADYDRATATWRNRPASITAPSSSSAHRSCRRESASSGRCVRSTGRSRAARASSPCCRCGAAGRRSSRSSRPARSRRRPSPKSRPASSRAWVFVTRWCRSTRGISRSSGRCGCVRAGAAGPPRAALGDRCTRSRRSVAPAARAIVSPAGSATSTSRSSARVSPARSSPGCWRGAAGRSCSSSAGTIRASRSASRRRRSRRSRSSVWRADTGCRSWPTSAPGGGGRRASRSSAAV